MLKSSLKRFGVAQWSSQHFGSIALSASISAAAHFVLGVADVGPGMGGQARLPRADRADDPWWAFDLVLKVERAHEQLRLQSKIDHLTGIFNRRYFMDRLREEIDRARRYNTPFAVAFIDVDNFKRINDEHGHLSGDQILRQLTSTARSKCARSTRWRASAARSSRCCCRRRPPRKPSASSNVYAPASRRRGAKVGDGWLDMTVSIGLTSASRRRSTSTESCGMPTRRSMPPNGRAKTDSSRWRNGLGPV